MALATATRAPRIFNYHLTYVSRLLALDSMMIKAATQTSAPHGLLGGAKAALNAEGHLRGYDGLKHDSETSGTVRNKGRPRQ